MAQEQNFSLDKPQVLLVDDRPENLLALEVILSDMPCHLAKATSGGEAISYLEKNEVALVLLDVQMPQMDGFQTAEKIRSLPLNQKTPIIFVTAIDQSRENLKKAYRSGAVDFLYKPLDPEIVASKVSIFLELFNARQVLSSSLKNESKGRQIAEREKKHSEQRFRALFEQATVPLMIFRNDGRVLEANEAWYELFDTTPNALENYNVLQDHQLEQLGMKEKFQLLFQGEKLHLPPFQYDPAKIGKKGRVRWLEVHAYPVKSEDGQVQEVALFEKDVTDHMNALRMLQKSENQYRVLAESSVALNSSLDFHHTLRTLTNFTVPLIADWCSISLLNPQGKIEQFAVAHKDPEKMKWALELGKKYPSSTDAAYGVGKVIRTGKSEWAEIVSDEMIQAAAQNEEHLRIIQSIGFRSFICVPLRARNEILGALTLVTTDESGRQYSHQDLQLAEAIAERAALAVDNARLFSEAQNINRIKDEFLATLSHELRTPLNVIQGHAELLKTEAPYMSPEELQSSVDAIFRNAENQNRIISDLLDVSAIVTGKMMFKPEGINPAQIASMVIDNLMPTMDAKGLTIHKDLSRAPEMLIADPTRLQQIIWNLLSNAAKFTPPEGEITVRLFKAGHLLQLEVEDTGIGIEPAFIPYLFDRFRQEDSSTTRRFGGLGLGLAIVRHLVELHGGNIRAESKGKGQGAKFIVSIPLFPAKEKSPLTKALVETSKEHHPELEGLKVLLLEKSEDNQILIKKFLSLAGAEVETAQTEFEAREKIKDFKPDLILSDLGLNEESNLQFLKHLRTLEENCKDIPAISLSEEKLTDKMNTPSGYQGHLSKPVTQSSLIEAITKVIAH